MLLIACILLNNRQRRYSFSNSDRSLYIIRLKIKLSPESHRKYSSSQLREVHQKKPNPQPLPYKGRGVKSKPLSLQERGLERGQSVPHPIEKGYIQSSREDKNSPLNKFRGLTFFILNQSLSQTCCFRREIPIHTPNPSNPTIAVGSGTGTTLIS